MHTIYIDLLKENETLNLSKNLELSLTTLKNNVTLTTENTHYNNEVKARPNVTHLRKSSGQKWENVMMAFRKQRLTHLYS